MSPGFLVMIAGALMLAFTLVPVAVYEYYMREPNLMFGNPVLYAFILACLTMLWFGSFVALRTPRLRINVRVGVDGVKLSPVLFFALPIFLSIALLVLTVNTVLANDPRVLVLALSGMGAEIKQVVGEASQGAFSGSLPLAMGVSWWALARFLQSRPQLSYSQSIAIGALLVLLIICMLLAATLLMARFVIIPAIFGLAVIYLRHKVVDKGQGLGGLLPKALLAAVVILVVFGVFSYFRTGGDSFYLVRSYIGYGPASVNHLAALLDGRFNLEALRGFLIQENFGFVTQFPLASRVFDRPGDFAENFYSSFTQTWAAGLNGGFNWFTALGSIAGGLGALAIPYLFIYGFVAGMAWRSFKSGSPAGVVIYPWIAYSVLFIFGYNMVSKNFLSILLVLSFLIAAYCALARPRLSR